MPFSQPSLTAVNEKKENSNPNTTSNGAADARHATFADMNRQWAGLPSNHLGNLVRAAVSSTVAAEDVVENFAESNLIIAADEAMHEQKRNPTSGRTVQDAINLDENNNNIADKKNEADVVPVKLSILQRPTQLDFDFQQNKGLSESEGKLRSAGDPINMPLLESQLNQLQIKSSQAMRQYLDLKEKHSSQTREIASLQGSLTKRQLTLRELQQKRIPATASLHPDPQAAVITADEHEAERVIAQLQRKLGELETSYAKTSTELASAKSQAYSQFNSTKKSLLGYRDPFLDANQRRNHLGMRVARNNGIFRSIEHRKLGLPIHPARTHALEGMGSSTQHAMHTKKALTVSRLSHAVTISSHRYWSVYCLKFDRTGRYFFTGADDFVVRIFCLGANQNINSRGKGRLGPEGQASSLRGAVLVATLRGHASVINDMDVSPDNCFLATASDDGDCRIWGLKDGSPVAILRGHTGGCLTVSSNTDSMERPCFLCCLAVSSPLFFFSTRPNGPSYAHLDSLQPEKTALRGPGISESQL